MFCDKWIKMFEPKIWNNFIIFFILNLYFSIEIYIKTCHLTGLYIWNPAFRLYCVSCRWRYSIWRDFILDTAVLNVSNVIQKCYAKMSRINLFCIYRFQDFSKFKFDFLVQIVYAYSIWALVLKIHGFCDVILCRFLRVFRRFERR